MASLSEVTPLTTLWTGGCNPTRVEQVGFHGLSSSAGVNGAGTLRRTPLSHSLAGVPAGAGLRQHIDQQLTDSDFGSGGVLVPPHIH